jgi:hypothetical protein
MTLITVEQPVVVQEIITEDGQMVVLVEQGTPIVTVQEVGIQGPPGPGGGGSNAPATVTGTADALALTGLTVGTDQMVITLVPIANNTGPATASINGGAALPILSRLGQPLVEDELIAGVPVMAILTPGVSLQLIVS